MTLRRTPLQKLNNQLRLAVQNAKQINELDRTSVEVSEEWAKLVNEMGQHALDVFYEAQRLSSEIEADRGHRLESLDARIVLEDKLRDVMTIIGPEGKNLALLQAGSLENMKEFVTYILLFGCSIFEQVLEELPRDQYETMQKIFAKVARKRD